MKKLVREVAILTDPALRCEPGNFGAKLSDNKKHLYVPLGVMAAVTGATKRDTKVAAEFLAAAFDRPSEVARDLDWAPSDVFDATKALTTELVLRDAIWSSALNHPMLLVG
ncbi:MAG: hypothetical protein JWO78_666 [Micavibrio sp.]|nr:hypothetical protein [Micavibrio sp.]